MKPVAPSDRRTRYPPWSGRLFVWGARGLYVGPTFRTERHAHHAVQLCIGLDGPLRFRAGTARTWSATPAVAIPSDRPHQIDGGGHLVALIFLDPEASEARAGLWGSRPTQLNVGQSVRGRLLSWWHRGSPPLAAGQVCDAVMDAVARPPGSAPPLDPRIARALTVLRAAPDRRMTLAELAAALAISQSRLVHLFGQQTGIPIRRYLLWLRLGDALQLVGFGPSLTQVAHDTGFADSAHLCRTFRRMLGLAPSALRQE